MLDPKLVRDIVAIVEETDVEIKLREAMRLTTRAQSGPIEAAPRGDGTETERSGPSRAEPSRSDPPQFDPSHDPSQSDPSRPEQSLSAASSRQGGSIRPGRPASWTIIPPGELADRPKLGSTRGRYLLLHSVAHIELSAVELALMAVADFPQQPGEYHRAMLQVAREEVIHTRMLLHRLRELGCELGSDPVHLALFETASAHSDLPARLAVVPRILEARGLDVSERLRDGLIRAGDPESAAILERIYRDEIGHVRTGTVWYREACAQRGIDGEAYFLEMMEKFRPRRGGIGPIDHDGRRSAGFTERELEGITGNPSLS